MNDIEPPSPGVDATPPDGYSGYNTPEYKNGYKLGYEEGYKKGWDDCANINNMLNHATSQAAPDHKSCFEVLPPVKGYQSPPAE